MLTGVTLGRGSVVAVGSVVTRDISPYSIAAGVPAKDSVWAMRLKRMFGMRPPFVMGNLSFLSVATITV